MPFEFKRLEIPDVIFIEAVAFGDHRGSFMETYKRSDFNAYGIGERFVQDNLSHSVRGVLRGLHYQKDPAAQGKLVCVPRGEIFAVAVDIRKGSPTYGRWVAVLLTDEECSFLYVPRGFAHGFEVISEQADVVYKVTAEYAPDLDRGVRWDDSELGIRWPIANPLLSRKDAQLPLLTETDNDFVYEESHL